MRRAYSRHGETSSDWIEDKTQNHIPLSTMTIMTKAKSLLTMLKEKARSATVLNLLLTLSGF